MSSDQKFRLAKTAIISTTVVITAVVICWLVVVHNPSSLNATVDVKNAVFEIGCTFMENNK